MLSTVVYHSQKEKDPPVVEVKHHTYQPSKAELEADMSIDATPEDVARAVMKQVMVKESKGGEE